MSNKSRRNGPNASDRARQCPGAEPVHASRVRSVARAAARALDRDARARSKAASAHGLGIDAYGVLVTMVGQPGSRMTIGELGERRNLSPSGISRSVDKLVKEELVERTTNPADARSLLVGLTAHGVQRLREAQVTHHATVRELLLDHLDKRDIETLGELWEKAIPGTVSSPAWPL